MVTIPQLEGFQLATERHNLQHLGRHGSYSLTRSPVDVFFQDMIMEIMDKYVQAGEALADKENDVRQLSKQVRRCLLSSPTPPLGRIALQFS